MANDASVVDDIAPRPITRPPLVSEARPFSPRRTAMRIKPDAPGDFAVVDQRAQPIRYDGGADSKKHKRFVFQALGERPLVR